MLAHNQEKQAGCRPPCTCPVAGDSSWESPWGQGDLGLALQPHSVCSPQLGRRWGAHGLEATAEGKEHVEMATRRGRTYTVWQQGNKN